MASSQLLGQLMQSTTPDPNSGIGGVSQGLQQGMQMAQAQQSIETDKVKLEAMKSQVEEGKWGSFQKRVGVALAAPKPVQNKLFDNLGEWMKQNAMDPLIAQGMKDADFQGTVAKAMKAIAENPKSVQAAEGLASLSNWATFHPQITGLVEKYSSMIQSSNDKEAARATAERGQDKKYDSAVYGTDARMDKRDMTIHEGIVKRLTTDKSLTTRVQQINNLENAWNVFNTGARTPEAFHELQQSIRSNLGIKGSSGVDEREDTYFKNLGLFGAKLKEIVTAKPADVGNYGNEDAIHHFEGLLNAEKGNVSSQAAKRIDTLMSGHGTFYKRRPDLEADLRSAGDGMWQQFQSTAPGTTPQRTQGGAPQASAPQAPPAAAGKPLAQRQQEFMAQAKLLKKKDGTAYSEAEIQALMPKK